MSEELLFGLASIIVLGIVAQWMAWRLRLPAILLLLLGGFLAGPVTGVLNPDLLFGDALFPLVSISVAIILFEGGLSLHFNELRKYGSVIRNLTTVGILITWILAGLGARFIAGIDTGPAILMGAILVVTGPTVIIPLLRQVRPAGGVGSIIKWEGIVNDPIGAILAVLVFEIILAGGMVEGSSIVIGGVLRAVIFGTLLGLAGAGIIVLLLRRYLIPDFLQNPMSLMLVVLVYTAADHLQSESGLLAVTVMGIALANQKYVSIREISEFKENLRVLLISSLFIILAARIGSEEFALFNVSGWIFVAVLILIIRPAAVLLSTLKSNLNRREKLFIAWMAPRGIVAAAVVSVFAIRLIEIGYPGCEGMVPLIFQVIIGTVAVYGLTAGPVARWLKVAKPNPQGVLIAGAQGWAQDMAGILQDEGFHISLVDTNWDNIVASRNRGLRAFYANILSENILYDVPLDGIGRLVAITSNDEVNSLAALHFSDVFGRQEVYQLPPTPHNTSEARGPMVPYLQGRFLFDKKATFDHLAEQVQSGATVKKTPLTDEFTFDDFRAMYGDSAVVMFVIGENKRLKIYTVTDPPSVKPGDTLISLVYPRDKAGKHHDHNGDAVT